jgi:cellulose biosynthesis protein BcsQ
MDSTPDASGAPSSIRGKVICFASAKGGSGKTIFAASTAYALLRSGKRVLCIDADFSTRGLSLLLLSSLIDTGDLDPPPYSCLAESVLARTPVEKLQPLTVAFGSIEFNVLVSNRNLRQGGIPEDRLLGSTGEGGTSHLVDLPVQEYFSCLQSLCDVMRNSFDYIVIDTRGGFDTTSVVPAIVSDSYCIVL